MSVIYVRLPYYGEQETFWSSRERMTRQFRELGGKNLKWTNGQNIPANWLGYSASNPSPGVNLYFQRFTVEDAGDALIVVMMGGEVLQGDNNE